MTWEGLTPPYSTIVADPPWPYSDHAYGVAERRFLPYSEMTVEDISELPVFDLVRPAAHLYLWTTNRYLEAAFTVARGWGFTPAHTLVWCKEPRGVGSGGGRFATTTEYIIHAQAAARSSKREVQRAGALIRDAREAAGLGRAELHRRVRGGKPTGIVFRWEADDCLPTARDWQRLQTALPQLAGIPCPEVDPPPPRENWNDYPKVDTTWWQWPRGRHSEKPPAFLDVVEQVSPGPYVELFARQPRLGWDSWGWGYEQAAGA